MVDFLLTSAPTASRRNVSVQEALASITSSPSSSKASSIETSNPGELLSENTLMRNPLSRVSTVTCLINHDLDLSKRCENIIKLAKLQQKDDQYPIKQIYMYHRQGILYDDVLCACDLLIQLHNLLLQLFNVLCRI